MLPEAKGKIDYFPQNSILTPHVGEFGILFNIINVLDLLSIKNVQNGNNVQYGVPYSEQMMIIKLMSFFPKLSRHNLRAGNF